MLGGGLGTFTESVLEATRHMTQMSHTSGAGGSSSLSLDGPVVFPHGGSGVGARRTDLLLVVEGVTSTSDAQSVGLLVTFTE